VEDTPNTQKNDRTRYVEELEGQDDYWLSITDASRICRVQDVSIRRAIASGRLPVRKQGAGDNKRTRFVRASDLPRANFPILDAGAAITSDIRKVDILDLPLQIKRLTQLLTQIQATQTLELGKMREELEAAQTGMQEQIKQILADMGALDKAEEATARRITALEVAQKDLTLHEQQEREAMQERWQTALAEMTQQQTRRIEEVVTQSLASLQQMETRLQEQIQQAYERLQTQFQADVAALRKEFEEGKTAEARRIDVLTRQIGQEKEQRENYEQVMNKVVAGADAAASDAKTTVATLASQLETERKARLALEERLSRLEATQQESARTSEQQQSAQKPSRSRRKPPTT
jgi:hypothetical protein